MEISGAKSTIDWYDANAQKYAESVAKGEAKDDLATFATLVPKGAQVLDGGCGSGRDTNLLTQMGYVVTGFDISDGLLEQAKKKYPNLTFHNGSILDLKFKGETFDAVWAHASMVHLEKDSDPELALSEFHRVLKPNGILYLLVKEQTGPEKTAVVSDKISGHPRFFRYYTVDEIADLLSKLGYELIDIHSYNELEKFPDGRPEVRWINAFSKKIA